MRKRMLFTVCASVGLSALAGSMVLAEVPNKFQQTNQLGRGQGQQVAFISPDVGGGIYMSASGPVDGSSDGSSSSTAPKSAASPVNQSSSGWYMRGDIGVGFPLRFSSGTFGNIKGITAVNTEARGATVTFSPFSDFYQYNELKNAVIAGVGVGYRFQPSLRMDITMNYFGRAKYTPQGVYNYYVPSGSTATDNLQEMINSSYDITQGVSSTYALLNGYVDGTSVGGFMPFISIGVGGVLNNAGAMTAKSPSNATVSNTMVFPANTTTNFAYGLGAGLGCKMKEGLTLEIAYKYVNLGKIQTKATAAPTLPGQLTSELYKIYSVRLNLNMITAGLRYDF